MTVLLAGCGDLGTEVGLRFAATGRRVLGLRRSPHGLPAEIVGQSVDLARERPVVPADTDIVVVALTARRTAEAYRATYVGGLLNVVDALADAGASPRIVYVSSTAVYGLSDGSWVDEDSPTEPRTETGKVLLEAEKVLRDRVSEAVVLRLAGIYGPGRGRVIEQVRTGAATVPASASYTNRIHRDDAAAAIVHLATRVDCPQPVYVGVDDAPTERAEVVRFLAGELGAPEPTIEHAASALGANKRCRNSRLRQTGFELTYPTYREGYRAILAGRGTSHR